MKDRTNTCRVCGALIPDKANNCPKHIGVWANTARITNDLERTSPEVIRGYTHTDILTLAESYCVNRATVYRVLNRVGYYLQNGRWTDVLSN